LKGKEKFLWKSRTTYSDSQLYNVKSQRHHFYL